MLDLARLRLAFSLGALFGGAYACAGGAGSSADGSAPGGAAAAGGVAGSAIVSGGMGGTVDRAGSGSTPAAGSGGGVVIDLDASLDAPPVELTEDAACGIGTAAASLRPLTLMIMFDRSGSLVNHSTIDPVTMLDRWQTATSALSSFFGDPRAAGLNVALRFFPDNYPEGVCTDATCDADACSEVLVDVGTLTAAPAPEDLQEAALLDAIAVSTPTMVSAQSGGTPIHPALAGALRWAAAYQSAHEEQKTVVVFLTDGYPLGCDEDFQHIGALSADALATSGIPTYSIGLADSMGVGSSPELMNLIATQGGTDQAYFIDDGPTAAEALLDTFDSIRGTALPCDFPVPEATDNGKPTDTSLVNVVFTTGNGVESTFTKVDDAAHCGQASAWHYDDDAAPTRIYLCPASCDSAKSEPNASLEVLVGCKPKLETPR